MFNEITPTYDLLNHLFSFSLDRRWRKIALRSIALPSEASVLDICTGTADIAITVAEHQRQMKSRIYGVDLSERMLQRGKLKIFRKNLTESIHLMKADALHLPFPKDTFNAVFLSFGLRNLLNRHQGIQEMTRVLKEHGQIAILEFSPPQKTILGKCYHWYLKIIIPFIGKIVSKSASAYHYLCSSIEQFPEPEKIVKLLRKNGLRVVSCTPLMFGTIYLYVAQK
jgi:demethylmenaquinone methyltransferase/2-methoxy-6-polyprenyl-1,4-benzoquinol methylase